MKIVIRHGILSNAVNMQILEKALGNSFKSATIDNQSYDWRASILMSGVRLAANLIAGAQAPGGEKHVVLVGHSMGGLVCRVANAAITDPRFRTHVATHAKALSKTDHVLIQNMNLLPGYVDVCAVVTLATPNSGAMRKGQLSALGWLLNAGKPFSFRKPGIEDLQTDHIFRVLQHCRSATPCLTISGSFGNRYGQGALRTMYRALAPFITTVVEPHDLIVEDESVDLSKSVLPHEFTQMVRHERAYVDCIDVTHTNIHANAHVHGYVANFIRDSCVA